jgi:histidine triad (HIT) family protein
MKNCLFCKIATNEIPSIQVYEDGFSLAFLDINPINPGHTLLIPKEHSRNIFDIKEESLKNMMPALKKISSVVKKSMGADGINIHINNEPPAGQVIFHTHIHIIPRFKDDNLKLWGGKPYKNNEIDKVAEKIKANIN